MWYLTFISHLHSLEKNLDTFILLMELLNIENGSFTIINSTVGTKLFTHDKIDKPCPTARLSSPSNILPSFEVRHLKHFEHWTNLTVHQKNDADATKQLCTYNGNVIKVVAWWSPTVVSSSLEGFKIHQSTDTTVMLWHILLYKALNIFIFWLRNLSSFENKMKMILA